MSTHFNKPVLDRSTAARRLRAGEVLYVLPRGVYKFADGSRVTAGIIKQLEADGVVRRYNSGRYIQAVV